MVLRNGWFSYRWTEILDMGTGMGATHTVLKAVPVASSNNNNNDNSEQQQQQHTQFMPMPVDQVCDMIRQERPSVFFMPHVETSTGMILPDWYMKKIADTVHEVNNGNGIVVLDCIASGTVWVDMAATGVDVLISAPQKGWTGSPCAALVLLSERAVNTMAAQPPNAESSFSLSLKRWTAIMDAYNKGGFAYHTTMPTDALRDFHEVTVETVNIGLDVVKERQLELGRRARAVLDSKGLVSVAAEGYQAPGVLVYYSPANTDNPVMMQAFHAQGLQIAMGVPWKIDEPVGLKTFRIGLFGLDKLCHQDETIATMERALDAVLEQTAAARTMDHNNSNNSSKPSAAA